MLALHDSKDSHRHTLVKRKMLSAIPPANAHTKKVPKTRSNDSFERTTRTPCRTSHHKLGGGAVPPSA